jgi:hypothetical protein
MPTVTKVTHRLLGEISPRPTPAYSVANTL